MKIPFSKYHGAGNDFIMIDNRSSVFRTPEKSADIISHICHRKFGIGGDGLILLNSSNIADFEMTYFNSDGHEGTMCGNGGRCCVAFACNIGIIKENASFVTVDGLHEAVIIDKDRESMQVNLKMQDIDNVGIFDGNYIIDSGSPHYVCFSKNIKKTDVLSKGREIRYSRPFKRSGINVNFAEVTKGGLYVRTYERGVEDETLSCGTGAVASAVAASISGFLKKEGFAVVRTSGGDLIVRFNKINNSTYKNIWLEGPVVCVFKGEINI